MMRLLISPRLWLASGALCGLLTVALGAFGAHALQERVAPGLFADWQTATRYLGLHGLAMFGCGLLLLMRPGARWLGIAGAAFGCGVLLFCGSLFAYALSGVRVLVALTPLGGMALMLGWLMLLLAVWRLGPADA